MTYSRSISIPDKLNNRVEAVLPDATSFNALVRQLLTAWVEVQEGQEGR